MRPLCVLLWKHCIVRKRRWLYSILEFSFSILLILPAYFSKDLDVLPQISNEVPLTGKPARALRRILYTPATNLTDAIMNEVGAKLAIPRLDHLPELKEAGFFPVSNLLRITDYLTDKQKQTIDAIVIFQDMDDTWPERLKYTICPGKDFNPSPSYPQFVPDSPIDSLIPDPYSLREDSPGNPGLSYRYEPLLRLQWAIDTAYLHRLTGANTNQTLTLQQFPMDDLPTAPFKIMLGFLVFACCQFGLVIIFVFLMTNLTVDKNSGIQELMKMEGVSINTICLAQFLNALPGGLVYAIGYTIIIKMSDKPMFPNSSSFIIFLAMMLHFLSIIPWAFIGAYLINSSVLITMISFFFYTAPVLIFDPVDDEIKKEFNRKTRVILTGLFPHQPLNWIITAMGHHEAYDRGVTFDNISLPVGEKNGSVLQGLLLMLVQSVLFSLLAWYLTQVRPGPYGQAMPCTFLCQKSYWRKHPEVKTVAVEERIAEVDRKYFEEPPRGLPTGIQIINVTKIFGHNVAVSNLSLNVYKGEITVLLGHNGAGKTTLMNIITGLMSATSGKVLVNGMDTSLMRKEVRSQMGLCPQHNLYFSDLTIMDHARFFGMLKGGKYSQIQEDSKRLLTTLNVIDKANYMAYQLSGGMKRRLQLACALAGGASVLILDEPTSGLDVETRRELWDLLLNLRGTRTVLLTTHFMEEADALGDRIAAMHAGVLRSHATPMFLKRAVGSGYRLSLTTAGPPREAAITAAIRGSIPEATVRDHSLKAISYNLPAKDSSQFPALFSNLEAKRSELGIQTIGVGKSSLEEVFLTLCSDITATFETDQSMAASVPLPSFPKLSGPLLCVCQFAYLLRRQFFYVTSKIKSFLFFQVFTPVLVIFLLAQYCNNRLMADVTDLSLDMFDALHRAVLYDVDSGDALQALRIRYSGVDFEEAPGDTDACNCSGNQNFSDPNRYLVGIKLNGTDATALYSSTVHHAAPVALNLLSNALAARSNASAGARTITTHVRPLTPADKQPTPKHSIIIGICLHERPGWLRPAAATLFAHVILGIVFLILPNAIAHLIFDADNTTNQGGFLASASAILLVGLLAICSLMYCASVLVSTRVTQCFLTFLNMIFGFVTPLSHLNYQTLNETQGLWYNTVVLVSYVIPQHTVVMALSDSGVVARLNAMCNFNKHKCPDLKIDLKGFDSETCCASGFSYWTVEEDSPGYGLTVLGCQFAVYSILLLLADHGFFGALYDRCQNCILELPPPRFQDPVVIAEKNYVAESIKKPKTQISDAILCYGVHKKFNAWCVKSHHAVKGVSFSVKKGQCLGLLGVNGAGKSTTFKMLNAEMFPTRGVVFSNGHFNHLLGKSKYMRTLSYCPQFFGLDDFLTGRQNLELVLTLRGLAIGDARREAASWVEEVGLTRYADKRVSTYSGGCARRLAAAGALCQHSDTALLDEPTAGVDVAARRRVHTAILRAKNSKAVIVASHSMDEMEALCDRLIIMSAGEICAFGSAAELRAQHASGYAVTFKLFQEFSSYASMAEPETNEAKDNKAPKEAPNKVKRRKKEVMAVAEEPTTSRDPAKEAVKTQFMQEMQRKFSQCELQDDHGTMMRYHIKNVMPYSELFALIEALKSQFPQLIEDYSLTETTLEEVFLFFAKETLAHKA